MQGALFLSVLFFVVALGSIATSSKSASPPVAQADVASPCTSAATTADMRNCEDQEFARADAALRRTFTQLLLHQDAIGKQKLGVSEKAWIRFRDADAVFQADQARGGTMEPLVKTAALTQATQARAAALQKYQH